MEFTDIVQTRYATKLFDGKEVPANKIEQLKELIKYSASSFGLQPYKILVIQDAEVKEQLSPLSWDQPQIKSCSHLFIFCADVRVKERIEQFSAMMKEAGIPAEKVAPYVDIMHNSLDNRSAEEISFWAQKQMYIALGNGLNGAKSLGLDSCPMEGFDTEAFAKVLGLPAHLVPAVIMPVGYAADKPKPKLRFDDLFEER